MDILLNKNLITTREAGTISGYSSDYLARLARSKKVSGTRIGHSWLIDRESLLLFLKQHEEKKTTYVQSLAEERALEYRTRQEALHQNTKRLTALVSTPSFATSATTPALLSQFKMERLRSQVFALSAASCILVSAALLAQTPLIPKLADGISTEASSVALYLNPHGDDTPLYIAASLNTTGVSLRTRAAIMQSGNEQSAQTMTSTIVLNLDLSRLQMNTTNTTLSDASLFTAAVAQAAPSFSLESAQAVVQNVQALIADPSRIPPALQQAYHSVGATEYQLLTYTLTSYQSLITNLGTQSLALAAATRDMLAGVPFVINQADLALGETVVDLTHALIHADVLTAYGLAAAAPESAHLSVALLGNLGDGFARTTAEAPALALSLYEQTTALPSVIAPRVAQAIFDVEYAGASRFIAGTNSIQSSYSSVLAIAGDSLYTSTQAIEMGASLPNLAAVAASAAPSFSLGEQTALTTYTTIQSLFSSAGSELSYLFAPRTILTAPATLPKAPAVAIATTTTTTSVVHSVTSSYPTYNTFVQGASLSFINESLAMLRLNILQTVAGMIPSIVASEIAANNFTHYTESRSGGSSIPKNATLDGATITNGGSISAMSGAFGNLSLGLLNGPLQANGGVVSATSSIGVNYGGTGLTTPPAYGQLLLGDGTGAYALVATSSLGINAAASVSATYPVVDNAGVFSLAFGTSTSNTWDGTQTFTNAPVLGALSGLVGVNNGATYSVSTSTLDIGGNANTVTNGVYTTTFNGLFDNRLSATSSVAGISALPNLSLPSSQVTGLGSLAGLSSIDNSNWSGTPLALANGGTGLASIPGNQILYSDSTGATLLTTSTSTLSIGGNAGTVTNGVYTTGAGTVFLAPNGSAAALTSFPTFNQNTTGTAAALAANGTNCVAGSYALGVDASGNAEGCTVAGTGTLTAVSGTWPIISSGGTTPVISFGGISTSSPIAAASGILYATGVNTFASVSTSSPLQLSITGNAATVTNGVYTTDAGTVFLAPNGSAAALTSFPIFNQNTTGTAGNVTGVVAAANGGTGQTSFTSSQLLYGNGTNPLSSVATTTLTGNNGLSLSGGAGALVGGSSATIGLAPIAANSVLGNITGSSGVPTAIATSSLFQIAAAGVTGLLSGADWTTFNNKGSGTVTAVSVASANGFAGSSSGGATPALTLSTTVSGLLKGNGTAISAAAAGTDYVNGSGTSGHCVAWGASNSLADAGAPCGSGGSAYPFTIATNYGVTSSATGTPIWAQAGLFASSTSHFAAADFSGFVGYATSTPWAQLSINPTAANGAAPSFVIGSSTATKFVVTNSGQVGIGTASPQQLLNVYGGASTDGALQISSNNGNYNDILRVVDTKGLQIQDGNGVAMLYFDNVDHRVAVNTSATPNADFEVTAAGTVRAVQVIGPSMQSDEGVDIRVNDSSTAFTNSDATLGLTNNNGGTNTFNKLSFQDNTAATADAVIAGVYTDTTNHYGDIAFLGRNASGLLERMRITGSGNVGIGNASPVNTLDIIGTPTARGTVRIAKNTTDSATAPTTFATATYLQIGGQEFNASDLTPSMRLIGFGYDDAAANAVSPAAIGYTEMSSTAHTLGDLIFLTRNSTVATVVPSERMRITAAGNVGIGTVSPVAKLQVEGADGPSVTGTTPNGTLFVGNTTAGSSGVLLTAGVDTTGAVSNAWLQTRNRTLASYYNLILNPLGGNVGIGTTAPSPGKLQIFNSSDNQLVLDASGRFTAMYFDNGGVAKGQFFYDNTNNGLGFTSTVANAYVGFSAGSGGNADQLRILSTGNVGVGTTSPYAKLAIGGDVVVGAATAGGTLGNLYLPTLATPAGTFLAADPTGKLIATTTPSGGGGTYPFTTSTDYAVTSSATGTPIWAQAGLFASSTSHFASADFVSATAGTLTDSGLTSGRVPFSTTGGQLTDSSALTYDSPNTRLLLSASVNGDISARVQNTSSGAAAYAANLLLNDASAYAAGFKFSSGYTTTGLITASAYMLRNTTGNMVFANDSSNPIIFASGGETSTNEVARFTTSAITFGTGGTNGFSYDSTNQRLNLGSAASTAGNDLYVMKTVNGQVGGFVQNLSTGTAGYGVFGAYNSANGIVLQKYSTGFTAAGLIAADEGLIWNSSGQMVIANNAAQPIIFGTGGSASANERMRITATGLVGIGTASPTVALTVQGAAIITNPAGSNYDENLRLPPSSGDDYASIALGAVAGTTGTGAGQWSIIRYPTASSNLFGIRYSSNASDFFNITTSGAVGLAGVSNPFGGFGNNATNIVGTDGAGLWSNTSLEWVMNAAGYVEGLYNAGSASNSDGLAIKIAGTASTNKILDVSTGSTQATAGTSRFVVQGNGNVGIGIGSPAYTLHVQQTSTAGVEIAADNQSAGTAAYSSFRLRNADAANTENFLSLAGSSFTTTGVYQANSVNLSSQKGVLNFITQSANPIVFALNGTAASNEKMRITSAGFVGIGTTTPYAKLSLAAVGGDVTPTLFAISSSTAAFATTTLLSVLNTGNVGIGTASPNNRLSVSKVPSSSTDSVVRIDNGGSNTVGTGLSLAMTGTSGKTLNIAVGTNGGAFISDGSLYFATNSNLDLNNPTNTRMIIDTSGNVSIGAASPSASYGTLTVAGTGIHINDDGNAKLEIGRYSAGVPNAYIKLGANAQSLRITNAGDTADLFTIQNGGNVGVGTTSPYAKLAIGGDVVVGAATAGGTLGNLYLPTLATPAGTFLAADASGKIIATTTPIGGGGGGSAYPFTTATNYGVTSSATGTPLWAQAGLFASSSTAYPTLAVAQAGAGYAATFMGGNVGIGTAAPGAQLHVQGTAAAGGGITARTENLSTAGFAGFTSWVNGAEAQDFNSTGSTFTTSGIFAANSTYLYGNMTGGTFVGDAVAGPLVFFTGGSAASNERMRILSTGNVGIGITTPGAKLTVISGSPGSSNPAYSGIALQSGNASQYTAYSVGRTAADGWYGVAGGANDYLAGTVAGDTVLLTASTQKMFFGNAGVGGATTMVMTSAGLGIGTSGTGVSGSPNAKLEVRTASGVAAFTGTATGNVILGGPGATSNNYATLDFSNTANNAIPTARVAAQFTSTGSLLQFGTSNLYTSGITNTAMTIDQGGKVGIGTASPAAQLHIYPNANSTVGLIVQGDNNQSSDIQAWESSSAAVLGRIGQYGGAPKATALSLYGGSTGSSSGTFYYDGPDNNNAAYAAFGVATGGTFFGTTGYTVLASSKNGTGTQLPLTIGGYNGTSFSSWMTLLTSGNVGVGTTSPYAKLAIGGDVVVGAATAGGTLGNLYLPTLATPAGTFLAADASGKIIATTTPTGGGGAAYPFTIATNYGVTSSATGTPLWAQAGLFASSTSHFANADFLAATTSGISALVGQVKVGAGTPSSYTAGSLMNFGDVAGDLIRISDAGTATNRYGIGTNSGEEQFYLKTTGHISFNSGGDLQTSGTNELMRIQGNGNVAIGKTSAGANLDVNGNVSIGPTSNNTYQLNVFGSTSSYLTLNNTSSGVTGTHGFQMGLENDLSANMILRENANLNFWTNNLNRVTIKNDGNVGIGNTSPGTKLEVKGALAAGYSDVIRLTAGNNTPGVAASLVFGTTYNDTLTGFNLAKVSGEYTFPNDAGTTAGGSLVFSTNHGDTTATAPVERMRITPAGNVGIGTTTPQWLLNPTSATASQLALSAGAGVAQWAFRNAGGNLYLATTTVAGTATTSTSALTIDGTTGNVTVGGLTDSGLTSGRVPFAGTGGQLTDSANFAWDNANQRLNIGGAVSTPQKDLYLDKSGTGGVQGIIQNSSSGSAAYAAVFSENDSSSGLAIVTTSTGYTPNGLFQPNAGILYNNGTGQMLIDNNSANPIIFATGGVALTNERMRITSAGSVGISTSTPYAKFSLAAIGGDTNTTLFAISSSTAAFSTSTLLTLNNTGSFAVGAGASVSGAGAGGVMGGNAAIGGGAFVGNSYYSIAGPNASVLGSDVSMALGDNAFVHGDNANSYDNYALGANAIVGNGSAIVQAMALGAFTTQTGSSGMVIGSGRNSGAHLVNSTSGIYLGTLSDIPSLVITAGSGSSGSLGNTGVGTTSPATMFEVGGATNNVTLDGYLNCIGFTTNANGLVSCTASDQRLKQDITTLDDSSGLAAITALNPVSFYWKDSSRGTNEQFGLIAQQVQNIFPNLVQKTNPTALTPDGTFTVNYEGLISPMILAIQELNEKMDAQASSTAMTLTSLDARITALENGSITSASDTPSVTALLASATNGINDLYAKIIHAQEVHTNKLCVSDDSGETCITRAQLDALIASVPGAAAASAPSGGSGGSAGSGATTTPPTSSDTTAPVVTLVGDAAMQLTVGDTFTDPGASATDDVDTAVQVVTDGSVDTTTAGLYTLTYSATDAAGNTASISRVVTVVAAPEAPAAPAGGDDTSSTPAQ